MKKTLAALVAGLVLGGTGTAIAGTSLYWERSGNDYHCEGIATGFRCSSGGFKVGTTKDFLYISRGSARNGPVFACQKWKSWTACIEG